MQTRAAVLRGWQIQRRVVHCSGVAKRLISRRYRQAWRHQIAQGIEAESEFRRPGKVTALNQQW